MLPLYVHRECRYYHPHFPDVESEAWTGELSHPRSLSLRAAGLDSTLRPALLLPCPLCCRHVTCCSNTHFNLWGAPWGFSGPLLLEAWPADQQRWQDLGACQSCRASGPPSLHFNKVFSQGYLHLGRTREIADLNPFITTVSAKRLIVMCVCVFCEYTHIHKNMGRVFAQIWDILCKS